MSLENSNVTIHIGMPKSASTTLQQQIFSQLDMVEYCGAGDKSEASKLFLDFIKVEESYFNLEQNVNRLKTLLQPEKPVIFSSEFACSYLSPISSGIPQSKTLIANRLAKLAPQAKIMIVIRNQFDLQKSLYNQLIRNESEFLSYKKLNFKKWINKNINLEKQRWSSVFELADYHTLIELYQNHFDNVKVFVFEEITENMEHFVQSELKRFLDIDDSQILDDYSNIIANKRHNQGDIVVENFLNKFAMTLKRRLGDPFGFIPKEKKAKFIQGLISFSNALSFGKINTDFTEEQKKFITTYYRESNRKTSELIGVDLSKYNYPT